MKLISVVLLSVILFVTNGAVLHAEKNNQRPNIIVMMVDDMGYGDPKCFNAKSRLKTPAIDRLSREGLMFTDANW